MRVNAGRYDHPAIYAPYNGRGLWVIARILRYSEIKLCGDFSLIETSQDKINKQNKKYSIEDVERYTEIRHNVVKLSMLSPKYDDLINTCLKYDNIDNIDDQLLNIEIKLKELESSGEKCDIIKLRNEYARLELQYKYVLPDDFISFIFAFALRLDESDIKLVSEKMLYDAAVTAKLGNDNPANHIEGTFFKRDIEDFNDRSWVEFFDREKEKDKGVKNAGRR